MNILASESLGWNVYQRADGRRVLQFRDGPRGAPWKEHRIPAEYRTERQAERYAAAWLDEYRKRVGERPEAPVEPPVDKGPTVRELAPKWLNLRSVDPKLSPTIRTQNKSNMRIHVLHYAEIADVPIADLRSGALRAWIRKVRDHGKVKRLPGGKRGAPKLERTNEPLAAYSVRNIANTITMFFDDAMAEEWIDLPANPMRHPGVRKEIPCADTVAGRRTNKRRNI